MYFFVHISVVHQIAIPANDNLMLFCTINTILSDKCFRVIRYILLIIPGRITEYVGFLYHLFVVNQSIVLGYFVRIS